MLGQRHRVGDEVVLREHRPLGAARGARGVEERREVGAIALRRVEPVLVPCGLRRQPAMPVGPQRQHLRAEPLDQRRQPRLAHGVADHHPRAAVLDEIAQLFDRVGGVERQKHQPRLRAGGIERERLRAFLDLCGNPVTGPETGIGQRMRDPRRPAQKLGMVDLRAVFQDEERCRLAFVASEQRVIKRVGHSHAPSLRARPLRGRRPRTASDAATSCRLAKPSWFCVILPRS